MVKLKMYKTKIPSDINNICPTICEMFSYIKNTYGILSENTEFEIRVILNELILNAIRHGNNENNNKYVKIKASITKDNKLLVAIEDEGQGYNTESLQKNAICCIDDIELCEMKVSGRGLIIVTNLCEKVRFNKKGNRIIVLKKLYPI